MIHSLDVFFCVTPEGVTPLGVMNMPHTLNMLPVTIKVSHFSPHLFWDTNRKKLDLKRTDIYIIKQVLEYGKINDWHLIKTYYGIPYIAKLSTKFRSLDNKALSFISTLSGIPTKEFRCYIYQQSAPQHWNF